LAGLAIIALVGSIACVHIGFELSHNIENVSAHPTFDIVFWRQNESKACRTAVHTVPAPVSIAGRDTLTK
jgi:hypothetical protein